MERHPAFHEHYPRPIVDWVGAKGWKHFREIQKLAIDTLPINPAVTPISNDEPRAIAVGRPEADVPNSANLALSRVSYSGHFLPKSDVRFRGIATRKRTDSFAAIAAIQPSAAAPEADTERTDVTGCIGWETGLSVLPLKISRPRSGSGG
jgi:hypothetical protein